MEEKILVTGAAGFIGYHVCRRLAADKAQVVGLDNLNDYYSVRLKEDRLAQLVSLPGFRFVRMDLTDNEAVAALFETERFSHVINLAAQAGVRYSLIDPHRYIDSNLTGFVNVLEGCRHTEVKHLTFASSSSVYGSNSQPWSVDDNVDHPLSIYAATKKSNELMAHAYAHLYGMPVTGLRFFTVYGPWGRPDAAYYIFTKSILEGQPIDVYNFGRMKRDFTYVDDIVECVLRVLYSNPSPYDGPDEPGPGRSLTAPYRVYNIGNDRPVTLLEFIGVIEQAVGKQAKQVLKPMQPGDVPASHADIGSLAADFGFRPSTPLSVGIARFVEWYCGYHGDDRMSPARHGLDRSG
ncbi:MAG TPA: SDR family NAD(P)-dependent oxidoreductase [Rhodothermales bacterium]|nr:SDR family NAD(P)-dependent oxidoreductase [Rhodothermales bacterium]